MRKKLLFNLLFCPLLLAVHADNLALQMQQINQSNLRYEDDFWQRMRSGFALNHKETKEVKYWEKRYSNPKYFNIIMQNAAPYIYFVVTEMERRGIPSELALIPIVESTYNPNAVSPTGISTGMWQFLNGSGKRFGMTINSDVDERKDILNSTRGAIAYLQYLYDLFGSWELAIAAYNWGEGNINNALNASSSRNLYDLDVRDVTHQYVPKIIALANIIQNPRKFGITLTNLPNKPYFAAINPPSTISVSNFMSAAQITPALNKKLNPQYNSVNYVVNSSQHLLLPVANQSIYYTSMGINTIPTTLQDDAAPVTPLIANNNADITSGNNDEINVLAQQGSTDAAVNAAPKISAASAPQQTSTAENNASLAADLLNDTNSSQGVANRSQTINNYTNYTVVQGDTLYSISKKFNLPIDTLKTDNSIIDNSVQLNQQLRIQNTASN